MIGPKTREDLGWAQLCDHLARRCRTSRGATLAGALDFFGQRDDAERRTREIAEARLLDERAASLPFGGITDVGEALARADKGSVLEPEELVSVAHLGRGLAALRRHLQTWSEIAPLLAEHAVDIADCQHVFGPILDAFDPEGRLQDHASDALGGLRRSVGRLQQKLESRVRALVDDTRLAEALQDRYWTQRDDRYVLPVKVEARGQVPGIVHGTSQSGQTVFVEPDAIVDLNNQLKLAECAAFDEERRILGQLTEYVAEEASALRAGAARAAVLDVIAASARLALDLGAHPATITDGHLELSRARHPLMVLGGKPCVANDVVLDPGAILVVSGPNAGGKTVALKTVGLAALMVRAGLHVAADEDSSVPWLESVYTAIGDLQSLENELSTFSAHLLELAEILAGADSQTLVLVDELCGATEPEQGAALAQSVLEELASRRVPAIVTTHYERLKALAADDPRLANASVGFDMESMTPTFRLHLGVPGASGAIDLARRLGLPAGITSRADEVLGSGRAAIERMLAEVADARDRLADEREELRCALAEATRARERAEDAERRARERMQKAHEGAHSEAVSSLREARQELDRIKTSLRRRRADDLRAADKRLGAIARDVAGAAPAVELPGKPAREGDLAPGVIVFVPSLGGRGEVLELPERGRVTVQVGALKTSVAVADLRLDPSARARVPRQPATPRRDRSPGIEVVRADDEGRTTVRTPDATLDLRGERVDEALDAVDRFVDQSLLAAREVVFVIHGHGTGALRQAVRGHLGAHAAVAKWRAGEPSEGGDGITIAWLD